MLLLFYLFPALLLLIMPNQTFLFYDQNPRNLTKFFLIPIITLLLACFYLLLIFCILILRKLFSFSHIPSCNVFNRNFTCNFCSTNLRAAAEKYTIFIPSKDYFFQLCTSKCENWNNNCQLNCNEKCHRFRQFPPAWYHSFKSFSENIHLPECRCSCIRPECQEVNCGCFSINFN